MTEIEKTSLIEEQILIETLLILKNKVTLRIESIKDFLKILPK